MSLFNFFQSYIEENPDLLKINNFTNPIYYDQIYDYNRTNQRRFEIEAFLAPMFNDNIVKSAQTIKEYEELTGKMRRICQVGQKLFTLSLLADKLEKEKYRDVINEQIVDYENKENKLNK